MLAHQVLIASLKEALLKSYNITANDADVILQKTRKEFEGDFTLVTFPFIKATKQSPEQVGDTLGKFLLANNPTITKYNVVKGFLNISLSNSFWLDFFSGSQTENYGYKKENSSGRTVMVEYASPNTNKPLHLGHIRNIILGYSVAEILKTQGHKILKVSIVNDRGIHICKSMLAWQKFGNGETPQSSGMKGDHLVGKYYVEFDKLYKKEIAELISQGKTKEEAEKQAPSIIAAQEMLQKWELGDKEVKELWKTMNQWVYDGFDVTYSTLGVGFDKIYYESNTYILGKEIIQEGLAKNIFYKKENGSVAIDLSADGLDEKVVLRSDGTSVYITQDIGTAIERFKEYPDLKQLIYTVGNEQDYHFKVLFLILQKLGYAWAKECYHLSYGMVELPEGKMKSREGTVVDADDLLDEMFSTAKQTTQELGKVEGFNEAELDHLYKTLGSGALKYFMLKVDAKKKMLFDPKESIDFNGNTGPFIQYTYARIQSVLQKSGRHPELGSGSFELPNSIELNELERELIKLIYEFPAVLEESSKSYNPSHVANYIYELAKVFSRFYHDCSILKEENETIKQLRLALAKQCGQIIKNGMNLLGIEVPNRM
ncbi:MAG: arginine--tRNA ligase [Bacteroidia bacterium]|nr:arginine--tRNA ligase [Bacteroidia bacterium]